MAGPLSKNTCGASGARGVAEGSGMPRALRFMGSVYFMAAYLCMTRAISEKFRTDVFGGVRTHEEIGFKPIQGE